MGLETLRASSHLAGDFPNPANAVGFVATTWAGTLNANTNYTSRWALDNPSSSNLTSGSNITVRCFARKGTNSGIPTIQLNLYENGVLRASGTARNVNSNTGALSVADTFAASLITNANNLEVEAVQVSAGGNPNTRNCAQIAYFEVVVDTVPPEQHSGDATVTATVSVSATGEQIIPASGTLSIAEPVGTNSPLAGYTERLTDGSWNVRADANVPGNKYLEKSITQAESTKLTVDAAGVAADQEFLAMVRVQTEIDRTVMVPLMVRQSGYNPGVDANYYAVFPRTDAGSDVLRLYEYQNGTFVVGTDSAAKPWAAGNWYVARMRAEGTSIKYRFWQPANPSDPGADEPVTWDIEYTDPTHTSGTMGMGSEDDSGTTVVYDYVPLGWATGGATAPFPAVGEEHSGDATVTATVSVTGAGVKVAAFDVTHTMSSGTAETAATERTGTAALLAEILLAAEAAKSATVDAALTMSVSQAIIGNKTALGTAAHTLTAALAAEGIRLVGTNAVHNMDGTLTAFGEKLVAGSAALTLSIAADALGDTARSGTASHGLDAILTAAGVKGAGDDALHTLAASIAATGGITTDVNVTHTLTTALVAGGASQREADAVVSALADISVNSNKTASDDALVSALTDLSVVGASTRQGSATLATLASVAATGTASAAGEADVAFILLAGVQIAAASLRTGDAGHTMNVGLDSGAVKTALVDVAHLMTVGLTASGTATSTASGTAAFALAVSIASAGVKAGQVNAVADGTVEIETTATGAHIGDATVPMDLFVLAEAAKAVIQGDPVHALELVMTVSSRVVKGSLTSVGTLEIRPWVDSAGLGNVTLGGRTYGGVLVTGDNEDAED